MTDIPRKYIVDDQNRKVAVQVDIEIFQKMEELLENYGLVQLIKESEKEEALPLKEARAFYNTLKKP